MFPSRAFSWVALIAALAANSASAISTISIKGSKFFTDDGNQFFIKGVAYQLTPDDPLQNTEQCTTDAELMSKLGANTVRVYHVTKGNHDGCMKAFADKGIYAFVDLDTFSTQINQDGPPHWNQTQLDDFTAILSEFAAYDNTIGVFVGNEIITTSNGSAAAPYIKAAARDVKAYRDSHNIRKVPVGYSAADISEIRPMLQNYLACGSNASENIDFFGLNAYEWCGSASSYTVSGYNMLVKNATDYPIPIFFSETGCNTNPPRDFADQLSIFSDPMDQVWSGAIIYEWIEETNNYGLVSYGGPVAASTAVGGDTYARSGTPTPVSPDFSNLQTAWASVTPTGVSSGAYSPTNSAPACPASTAGVWNVDGDVALPSLGQTAATGVPNPTGTATGTAAKPTASKKGSASGGNEIAGMCIGLASVMLGFIWWL